jgi:hypothetical protein
MAAAGNDVSLAQVRYARNFACNLENIEALWFECGFPEAYDRLLEVLAEVAVLNLQQHPCIGRQFLERSVDSVEAKRLSERIASLLAAMAGSAQLREYVMDDYLVLYAYVRNSLADSGIVQLLAIKHQKQLGFDVGALDS